MNRWLVTGGVLSLAAALLHVAVILGGPDWYRFFGAGEGMARAAAQGSWVPPAVTAGIAAVLATWSAYAFSGAGIIFRLPLQRTALVLISLIYLARAFILVPTLILRPELVDAFAFWSSLVVLVFGVTYAIGTVRAWRALGKSNPLTIRAHKASAQG